MDQLGKSLLGGPWVAGRPLPSSLRPPPTPSPHGAEQLEPTLRPRGLAWIPLLDAPQALQCSADLGASMRGMAGLGCELWEPSLSLPAPTKPRNVRIRRGEPLAKTPKTKRNRGDRRTVAQKRKFRSVHGRRAGLKGSPGNTPLWLYVSCRASCQSPQGKRCHHMLGSDPERTWRLKHGSTVKCPRGWTKGTLRAGDEGARPSHRTWLPVPERLRG